MKRRNQLILSLVALTGLVACGGTSESAPSAPIESNLPETTLPSDVVTNTGTVKPSQTVYEVELKQTITVRANLVNTNLSRKLLDFSTESENIEIDANNAVGVTSVKVTGKKLGSATITISASDDPTIFTTVTVNVVPFRQALKSVWTNIIKKTNYTLTSTIDGTDEVENVLKVTEDGITLLKDDGTAAISTKTYDEDDNEVDVEVYGIGLNEDGYAYYLMQQDGAWKTPEHTIQGRVGLLNSSNYMGLGKSATNWLEVDSWFYGLQAINPSWLSSTKEETNEYEIDGSSKNAVASYVEALLWGLIDPNGRDAYVESEGITSYSSYDLAGAIDTIITVVDNNTVSINITENATGVSHTATLSDVGSTALDAEVSTYMASVSGVTIPDLATDLQDLIDVINENDYSIIEKMTFGTYTTYYAPEYYFNGYTQEVVDNYYNSYGEMLTIGGYLNLNNAIYSYTITPEDGETPASITLGSKVSGTDGYTIDQAKGYLKYNEVFSNAKGSNLIYSFAQYSDGNGGSFFYSTSKDVSDLLSSDYLGDMTIEELIAAWNQQGDDYEWVGYGTEIMLTRNALTKKISGATIGFGTFIPAGSTKTKILPVEYSFVPAAESNQYDALIKQCIADNTITA